MAADDAQTAGRSRRSPGRPRLDAEMVPRILDAAERLFASRGPVGVSVRDIAAEAGLPHSSIYRYFASKDDVLRQVLLRGRTRQIERDASSREEGRTLENAVEWLMTHNRAYVLAVARAALEGQTASSLGLDRSQASVTTTLEVLESGRYPFPLRTDHDPRLVVATLAALSIGWAVAEDWVIDTLAIDDCDIDNVRQQVSEIMGSIMALGAGPRKECRDPETAPRGGKASKDRHSSS